MARSVCFMLVVLALASFAGVNASLERKLLQKPPATKAKPTCVTVDVASAKTKLCVAQSVFVKSVKKPQVLTPVTVADILVASDAACIAAHPTFAFADPAGTAWGGATGRCFNGLKYTIGPTWTKLKCCQSGAPASPLAKARDTAAEMGTRSTFDLARVRDTAAEMGLYAGSSGLARYRDTMASLGLRPGDSLLDYNP